MQFPKCFNQAEIAQQLTEVTRFYVCIYLFAVGLILRGG